MLKRFHWLSSVCLLLALALAQTGCKTVGQAPSTFDAENYQYVVDTLCADEMEGRDAGTEGIKLARDFLIKRFKAAGLEPAFVVDGGLSYTQPLTIPTGRDEDGQVIESKIENVGALLPGVGELAGEVIIVGAHYDHIGYGHYGSRDPEAHGHIHPGADDNASGTAGVVLLADLFAKAAQERTDSDKPRRTILFTCFAGEERGLFGSRYMTTYPDQWAFDKDKAAGMINMDMIGRLRSGELYVFGDGSGRQWREWINAANEEAGLSLQLDIRAPGGSDHVPFIMAGIPAVFFNTWLHDDYHTPRDTPDKINAEGSVQVLGLVAGVLDRAATLERVEYVSQPQYRPRPYLGVMLGQHERGVLLRDVVVDGPMDKAGGRTGDVLLSMAGEETATAGALRSALAKAKPGDEVVVTVLRGEEEIELTVELGRR